MRLSSIVLTTLCLLWSSVGAEEYKYPFRDPYIATVTAAVLNGEGVTPKPKRQVVHVSGLPGRNQVSALKGRGEVSVAVYRQNHPAPLLFILSGIGSNAYFGLATYVAGLFYQEGFHVVILPSPMSWNFALAASRSGAPGYAPEDARHLYETMQTTLGLLRTRYHVATTRIDFLGASLGALEGAYLSVIDAEERKIGIDRYLLLNPPLDLAYALDKVDEWTARQNTFGREKSKRLVGTAVAIVASRFRRNASRTLRSLTGWQRSSRVSPPKRSSSLLPRPCKRRCPNSPMSRKAYRIRVLRRRPKTRPGNASVHGRT